MKKRLIAIGAVILVAAAAAGGYAWYRGHQVTAPTELTLYGNVDIRQVSLAFDASGRISEMNVDEGQVVEPGQVLAKLDTRAGTAGEAGRGPDWGSGTDASQTEAREPPAGNR